jgi:hypothetical protein
MAAHKVDWVLDGLIPWAAAACWLAATMHPGGAMQEIVVAE